MPRYPKSSTWPATVKRTERILADQEILLSTAADEIGISRGRLRNNLRNGNHPSPKIESRIVKWCDKHNPKKKNKA